MQTFSKKMSTGSFWTTCRDDVVSSARRIDYSQCKQFIQCRVHKEKRLHIYDLLFFVMCSLGILHAGNSTCVRWVKFFYSFFGICWNKNQKYFKLSYENFRIGLPVRGWCHPLMTDCTNLWCNETFTFFPILFVESRLV